MATQFTDEVMSSTDPRLPPELWLAIFEQFEQLVRHDVYRIHPVRDFRSEIVYCLQQLELVCRTWRNMIRPLKYRHVIFEAHDGNLVVNFPKFVNLFDPNRGPGSAKASWIQSLWLCGDGYREYESTEYAQKFKDSFTSFFPQLSALRDISLLDGYTARYFESLTRYHGLTLKVMEIDFHHWSDLPKVLPLMKHFTNLQDWRLNMDLQNWRLDKDFNDPTPYLNDKTELPSLRRIELAARVGPDSVVDWLSRSAFPKLTEFKIRTQRDLDLTVLSKFMARHGSNLRTFRFNTSIPSITTAVFPYTPHLTRLELGTTLEIVDLLQGLPTSVTEIIVSGFGLENEARNNSYILRKVAVAVEQLPRGSSLHVLRASARRHFLGSALYTWRTEVSLSDRRKKRAWKIFKHSAKRLLEIGIVIKDEEGVVLSDFIKNIEPL